MKKTVIGLTVLLSLILAATAGNAQTPRLQIFFDDDLTVAGKNCPAAPIGTVLDSMFFVVQNFNGWLSALEFRIDYPDRIFWWTDRYPSNALTIGSSPNGVAIAWPHPFNAFGPAVVGMATFVWMCNSCMGGSSGAGCAGVSSVICPVAYPSSGLIRAVRWPDQVLINAVAGGAAICPLACGGVPQCPELPVPVEETTWGQIKAMYR
jgi:hypothetical protein